MSYKRLYIFIEGPSDKRFFEAIVKPKLLESYDDVQLIMYAQKDAKWKKRFLRSIDAMNAEYVWIADINHAPCITKRKRRIVQSHNFIDEKKIYIVRMMIESWYIAGISDNMCSCHRMSVQNNTETLDKCRFESLKPRGFDSSIDFMVEICKHYSIERAMQRNESFHYFSRYCIGL